MRHNSTRSYYSTFTNSNIAKYNNIRSNPSSISYLYWTNMIFITSKIWITIVMLKSPNTNIG